MNVLDAARPAADALRSLPSHARVRLVAHNDADGITAAAVMVGALRRLRRTFYVTYALDHDRSRVEALDADPFEANVFLDIGATWISAIERLPGRHILVDHHPLRPVRPESPKILHVNPHLYDPDDPDSASGSTLALALAIAIDPANWDQAACALVGAYADRQATHGIQRWNAEVLAEGTKRGLIAARRGLRLPEGPLEVVLRHPPAPWNHEGWDASHASAFLKRLRLPARATPQELPSRDQETLASGLVLDALRAGVPAFELKSGFRDILTSTRHDGASLSRMSRMVTAAAREGESGLGLSYLLGDREARRELSAVETRYHDQIQRQVGRLGSEGPAKRDHIQVAEVTADNYTGEVAGLVMHLFPDPRRPTVAFARTSLRVRVSARGTPEQLSAGLDVGTALAEAASAHDGQGGGHRIAGGALIAPDRLEGFLRSLDRRVGEMLGESA